MKIKINIFSPNKIINLILDSEKNFGEYNGIEISRNFDNEISKLIDIFSNFKAVENNTIVFDDEKVNVEIVEGNTTKTFSTSSFNLENYNKFITLVEDIIKCF